MFQVKILVTGATGYIGSQLTKRLVAQGFEVAVLVRAGSKLDILNALLSKIQVKVYDGNYSSLEVALQNTQPQIVVHTASLFLAQHSTEDVSRLIESNLSFPTQLLEAMSRQGIKKFINTGTSWQHYKSQAYNPVNLYAATKQAFEDLLVYYVQAKNFDVLTLKLCDTYGPGDSRSKLFSLLRNAARTGAPLRMSPGEQIIDLTYISDVIDAYLLAIAKIPSTSGSQFYAVTNPDRLILKDLVKVYSKIVNRPLLTEWSGLPYRPREVFDPWTPHQTIPGWYPRVMLDEGISTMEKDASIGGLLVESNS